MSATAVELMKRTSFRILLAEACRVANYCVVCRNCEEERLAQSFNPDDTVLTAALRYSLTPTGIAEARRILACCFRASVPDLVIDSYPLGAERFPSGGLPTSCYLSL
jgi:hypothetical protein